MSDEKKEDKWASLKIKRETKEKLKDMGIGISRAVDKIVEAKEQVVKEKVQDIAEVGEDIANVLIQSGLFDIKFRGGRITGVSEDGEEIKIDGYFLIGISDKDVREEIVDIIKGMIEE